MKYRILLLLALLCAIPVAAAGGTLASYSYETAFSFSIEPSILQTDVSPTPETAQIVEKSGPQATPDMPKLEGTPVPVAPDTKPTETPETVAVETPVPDNQPTAAPSPDAAETAKPTDTPDAAQITAANEI